MKKIVLSFIRGYQRYLNLNHPIVRSIFPIESACRFSPTCSDYMYEAVEKHGIMTGLFMGVARITRCHPWAKGGFDPVS